MDWLKLLKELFGVGFAQNLFTGLIIFFIGNIITKIKAKKDYMAALKQANLKVFYILRRLISEQELPNKDIFLAIHNSIARDYRVMPEDMESYDIISENLVKEIMDTDFLSYEEKLKYSTKALTINQQIKEHSILFPVEKQREKGIRPSILNVLKDVVSAILIPSSFPITFVITVFITFIIAVLNKIETDKTNLFKLISEMSQSNMLFPFLLVGLLLILIGVWNLLTMIKQRQREREWEVLKKLNDRMKGIGR
ncbi:hypothetical protein [Peribacillus frigoritolerans]|uniref:Uncharacterized protein n=1 Tax=Peribacillus castrilensis TaxID=2897690 RepID=A0AAW9NFQ3_9BACI|nr:hypothetical protein [Peribacillus castrilensis]